MKQINMSSFIIIINSTFSSNTYIWDLGKWYWLNYLQGRHGGADVGNGLVDTVGEGESETNGESSVNIYSLSGVRWIVGEKLLHNTGSLVLCSLMTWGQAEGWEAHERGNICMILFSLSVMFNSLQSHGLKHARIPCPSVSPGVCSNSCP